MLETTRALELLRVGLWKIFEDHARGVREVTADEHADAAATLLGALHHELGHHARASELLVERARALDPDLPAGDDLQVRDAKSGTKQLLETARRVSRAQRRTIL